MLDIVLRYLARVFVNAPARPPSADNFAALATAIGRSDFLPLPFEEVAPVGQQSRIGLRSANGIRRVFLRGDSLDFEYREPVDPAEGRIRFVEFAAEAEDLLARGLVFLGGSAHRIAVVREGLLKEMPVAAMDAVALKLLGLPEELKSTPPFEWDWRAAVKVTHQFGSAAEPTNTIATVKRLGGTFNDQRSFDRIFLSTDVNTTPDDTAPRFAEAELRAFCASSVAWHDELARNVLAFSGVLDAS